MKSRRVVMPNMYEESLFPSRTAVGREAVVFLVATPKVFGASTEVGARLRRTTKAQRQARLPLGAGQRA